jgi:hypothetical protein
VTEPGKRVVENLRGPVEWLLGPSLVGKLRKIILSSLFSKDLDLRDWMCATTWSRYTTTGAHDDVDRLATPATHPDSTGPGELWFDFIADSGDSQLAMYSLACLLHQDLHVTQGTEVVTRGARQVRTEAHGAAPPGWMTLRRGQFLMMGGDSAYHVADEATLQERVVKPFEWALADVPHGKDGQVRQVFAIPGNHDYFDQLVGFNRMFRRLGDRDGSVKPVPRSIPGYQRGQDASYFRIELPWGWEIWGIDPGRNRVDVRQTAYFHRGRAAPERVPKKLVLCTPSPPVVHGRVGVEASHLASLVRLEVPAPFLAWDPLPPALDAVAALAAEAREPAPAIASTVPAGGCLLDLSGDVHHYARYAAADEGSYAAVVSGLGGAFHHPTFTDFADPGVPAARRKFPEPSTSTEMIRRRLVDPRTVFDGGFVRLVIGLVALVLFAGALDGPTAALTNPVLSALAIATPSPRIPATWYDELGLALLGLGSVVVAALSIWAARGWWRYVSSELAEDKPDRSWLVRWLSRGWVRFWVGEYGFAIGLVALAIAVPYGVQRFYPAGAFETLFVVVVLAAVVGFGWVLPVYVGAPTKRGVGEKATSALWGLVHGAMQLVLAVAITRSLTSPGGWLALVALTIAPIAVALRPAMPRGVLVALWIGQAVVALLLVRACHGAEPWLPASGWERAGAFGAAIVVGMVVGCSQFGLYLLVAAAWNGHNNEAGSAARIDTFQQLIRFRVTEHELRGYVIALVHDDKRPEAIGPADLKPLWIDTIVIKPRGNP